MLKLKRIRKVVVVVETSLEQLMLAEFAKLGAKGYTVVHCIGKGRHAVIDEPFMGHSQARIETLCGQETADKIMKFCLQPRFEHYPVTAYMEEVEVDERAAY